MGWFDRVKDTAGGFVRAGGDLVGMVTDVVTWDSPGPWDRLGDMSHNLFSGNSGLGAAIGAVPRPIRRKAGDVAEGALIGAGLGGVAGGLAGGVGAVPGAVVGGVVGGVTGVFTDPGEKVETFGRENIREPLATAVTAGSLADADGGVRALFKGSTWRQAHRIAQDRSVGQSFSLMFGTKDILNQAEVERWEATAAHQWLSGTTDGIVRFTLEPDVIAGKSLTVVRGARVASRSFGGLRSRREAVTDRLTASQRTNIERRSKIIEGGATLDEAVEAVPLSAGEKIAARRRKINTASAVLGGALLSPLGPAGAVLGVGAGGMAAHAMTRLADPAYAAKLRQARLSAVDVNAVRSRVDDFSGAIGEFVERQGGRRRLVLDDNIVPSRREAGQVPLPGMDESALGTFVMNELAAGRPIHTSLRGEQVNSALERRRWALERGDIEPATNAERQLVEAAVVFNADPNNPATRDAWVAAKQAWVRSVRSDTAVDPTAARGAVPDLLPHEMTRSEFESTNEALLHGAAKAFDEFVGDTETFQRVTHLAGRHRRLPSYYFTNDPATASRFAERNVQSVDVYEFARRHDLDPEDALEPLVDALRKAHSGGKSVLYRAEDDQFKVLDLSASPDELAPLLNDAEVVVLGEGGHHVRRALVGGKTLDLTGPKSSWPAGVADLFPHLRAHERLSWGEHESSETLVRWLAEHGYGKARLPDAGGTSTLALADYIEQVGVDPHRRFVERALEAGEPVPRQVLDDYPDLLEAAQKQIGEVPEAVLAARIGDRFFPNHPDRDLLGGLLAQADDMQERSRILAAALGDQEALTRLAEQKINVAAALKSQLRDAAEWGQWKEGELFHDPDVVTLLKEQTKETMAEFDALDRLDGIVNSLDALPDDHVLRAARHRVVRSEFYQRSVWAKPVRMSASRTARGYVDLHSPTQGVEEVGRLLRQAGFSADEVGEWRTRMAMERNANVRAEIAEQAEDAMIRRLAEKAGLIDETASPAEVKKMKARVESLINEKRHLRKVAGKPNILFSPNGRGVIEHVDDHGNVSFHSIPLMASQEPNVFFLTDPRKIEAALRRMKGGLIGAKQASDDFVVDHLDAFYRLWKPGVLFRPAWPMRVVTDEQGRILAEIGAMAHLINVASQVGNLPHTAAMAWRSADGAGFWQKPPEFFRSLRPALSETRASRTYTYGDANVTFPGPTAGVEGSLVAAKAEADGSFRTLLGDLDGDLRREFRSGGDWRTYTATQDGERYYDAWERVVNRQIMSDPLAQRLLDGRIDNAKAWLDTPAGTKYLRDRHTFRRNHVDEWLEELDAELDHFLPTEELRRRAATETGLSRHDLVEAVPDEQMRPTVHGEQVAQLLGVGTVADIYKRVFESAFKAMAVAPTTFLSRHEFFDEMYRRSIARQVDAFEGSGAVVDDAMREAMATRAREDALQQTQHLLYDLAEQTELAEAARFLFPFLNAWQEVASRWAGLAWKNPAFIARAKQMWNSPEKAGLVVDEHGNEIRGDGKAVNPVTGEVVKAGEQRHVRFVANPDSVPDLLKAVPGAAQLAAAGFSKDSMNMLFQAPSPGVVVQLPLNEALAKRPDLEESLKWALPFGVQETGLTGWLKQAAPTAARNVAKGEDDTQMQQLAVRIYNDMQVDFNLDKREQPPTWAEARRKAEDTWKLKTAAQFMLPVGPQFFSPYQPYIDAYRRAQDRYAKDRLALADENGEQRTPDQWFLDTFGDEFFPLTQALSESLNGVPATVGGWRASKKYAGLIEQFPDLGGLIVGAEGAGEFNASIFRVQMESAIGENDPRKQRRRRDVTELLSAPQVRAGWIEYRKVNDWIDYELEKRGLSSLNVKEATDLRELRAEATRVIEDKYPEWGEQRGQINTLAWPQRMKGLRAIAESDAFPVGGHRRDIDGLRDYLEARDWVVSELRARDAAGGAKSLAAQRNRDLAAVWAETRGILVRKNPMFADLFYRWLEHDEGEKVTASDTVEGDDDDG